MARWRNNQLWHNWFGSDTSDLIGVFMPNTDKKKPYPFVFVADTNTETFRKFCYEKPDASELLGLFMEWQN